MTPRISRTRSLAGGVGTTAAAMAGGWLWVHRSAPAVRGWTPSRRTRLPARPLAMTGVDAGDAGATVVLLHGIVGSGRGFGADYDHLGGRVVALDVLGFGASMHVETDGYTVADHTAAVMATLESAGLAGTPILLVGHSMGAVLALHVGREVEDLVGVVALSGPLYDDPEEAMDHIGQADPLASVLATGDLAERICNWMCAHRELAQVLWPIFAPNWPWPVAADGVLHTWASYRESLESLVLDSGYEDALSHLAGRGIPVVLLNGDKDGVPVRGRAEDLAARLDNITAKSVSGAGHELPMSHAPACADAITALL